MRSLAPFLIPLAVLVALVAVFLVHLSNASEKVAGGNSVPVQQPVVFIPGHGGELCQATLLPRGASAVQLWVKRTRQSGPPLDVSFTSAGRELAHGHFDGNWGSDTVRVPIGEVPRTRPDAVMCVRNQGRPALGFMGIPSNFATLKADGKTLNAAVTVQFFRAGESSWWANLGTIAHRAGVLKGALAGAWVFWAAITLFAAVAVLSLIIAFSGRRV